MEVYVETSFILLQLGQTNPILYLELLIIIVQMMMLKIMLKVCYKLLDTQLAHLKSVYVYLIYIDYVSMGL